VAGLAHRRVVFVEDFTVSEHQEDIVLEILSQLVAGEGEDNANAEVEEILTMLLAIWYYIRL
jgi:hypothetical protein